MSQPKGAPGATAAGEQVRVACKALALPSAAHVFEELVALGTRENWSLATFAAEWLGHELEGRRQHRITRLSQDAHLPAGKTLALLDQQRLPLKLRRLLPELCGGGFVDRAKNVLLFGLPDAAGRMSRRRLAVNSSRLAGASCSRRRMR